MMILLPCRQLAFVLNIIHGLVYLFDTFFNIYGVNLIENIGEHVDRLVVILVLAWLQSIGHSSIVNVR